jgi:Ca-activated chloride channel family protein
MKPLLLCLLTLGCAAQTPFRVDVHLVNVGFSVRDAAGKMVDNLTADDFDVLEDGAPQKIAFFARGTDVALNLGLVVDVSGSQEPFVRSHQKDLKIFLDRFLTPRDHAFLVCFARHPRLVAAYTSSSRRLMDTLDSYFAARTPSGFPILGPREIRVGGTAFFDAVYHSVSQMFHGAEPGRRALLIFSDGEDNTSAHHELDAIEIAQANDVMLFAIRYTDVRDGQWDSRNKYGRGVMERLAADTGGAAFDAGKKSMAEHFREIEEQLRSSYELGYHSTNPADDGTFHKVTIRVKRPGMTVRARTGYYARPGN